MASIAGLSSAIPTSKQSWMALPFFLTEAAHGRVISGFANVVPSLLYAAGWAVLEGLVDSVCELEAGGS